MKYLRKSIHLKRQLDTPNTARRGEGKEQHLKVFFCESFEGDLLGWGCSKFSVVVKLRISKYSDHSRLHRRPDDKVRKVSSSFSSAL
jgi:hypothetical protein